MAIHITTPGDYVTRDGSRVTVHAIGPTKEGCTTFNVKGAVWRMFRGKVRPKGLAIWTQAGRALPLKETTKDIVGPWVD